jgi:hypothetical protein
MEEREFLSNIFKRQLHDALGCRGRISVIAGHPAEVGSLFGGEARAVTGVPPGPCSAALGRVFQEEPFAESSAVGAKSL